MILRLYRFLTRWISVFSYIAVIGTIGVFDVRPLEFEPLRAMGFLLVAVVMTGVNMFLREVKE